MPRFLLLVSPERPAAEALSPAELGRRTQAFMDWVDELRREGVLDSGGLLGADSVRLETEARLESYPLLAATRADFLRRLGRFEEAIDAYRRALGNTRNEPERRYLEGRVAQCKTALE